MLLLFQLSLPWCSQTIWRELSPPTTRPRPQHLPWPSYWPDSYAWGNAYTLHSPSPLSASWGTPWWKGCCFARGGENPPRSYQQTSTASTTSPDEAQTTNASTTAIATNCWTLRSPLNLWHTHPHTHRTCRPRAVPRRKHALTCNARLVSRDKQMPAVNCTHRT